MDGGNSVTVAYQIRDYFKKNDLPEGCRKIPLVHIESGKYHKRVFKLMKSIFMMRRDGACYDAVYSFSFDLLLISLFIKASKRYYEIGDLRIIDSTIYNFIYRKILRKQNKVIVTSAKFSEYLQQKYGLISSKIEIVENKLNPLAFIGNWQKAEKVDGRKIKVGIIGLLRYRQVLDFLEAVTTRTSNIEVHIYGAGVILDNVLEYTERDNVFYHGEFKYPDDLNSIYKNVDISFVMYNSEDLNVRLALPNKLYESIYYKTPLIVSSGTYLAEKVEGYDIGFAWDINNIEKLPMHLVDVFESRKYNKYVQNCDEIDRREIFSDSELSFSSN